MAPGSARNWTALFSRQQPGGYFVAQNMPEHPNGLWFVGSTYTNASDAVGNGRSPAAPFATLDYGVSHGDIDTGDTIYVLPGHVEDLDEDGAVNVDVSNLQILGLGWGGCRPTFTCTAVAGDFKLAASCGRLENILFINAVDDSTGLLEISAADWTLRDIEIRETSGAVFADVMILTVDGADRLHINGLRIIGNAADGAVSAIELDGSDDLHIENFYLRGNYDTGAIQYITTASLYGRIHNGTIWQEDDTAGAAGVQMILDTVTGSSGIMGPFLNLVGIVDAANITEAITGATFNVIDPVYVNNAVNEKGMLINWTASTD